MTEEKRMVMGVGRKDDGDKKKEDCDERKVIFLMTMTVEKRKVMK